MKNLFKLIGIIALAAAIVFTMMACEEAAEEEAGTLIIEFNGSNTYNDKLVEATAMLEKGLLIAAKAYISNDDAVECAVVRNRRVILSVWDFSSGKQAVYTKSDQDVEFEVYVYDDIDEDGIPDSYDVEPIFVTVSFKKGVGTTQYTPHVHVWNSTTGKCDECGDSCAHAWNAATGVCNTCGITCVHTWNATTGECDTCGFNCTHVDSDSDNECDICGFDMT